MASCSGSKVDETIHSKFDLTATYLHDANIALEQDIIHDFFSPPVASRIYLYPNLVAYEILANESDEYKSLTNAINGFPIVS